MNPRLVVETEFFEKEVASVIADGGPEGMAALRATNEVGRKARTAVVSAVRAELDVSAKSMRKRVKFYAATKKRLKARLWGGTRIGIALYEGGTKNAGVMKAPAPTSATFVQRMKSGHRGLFYRSTRSGAPRTGKRLTKLSPTDTPIKEVRIKGIDVARSFDKHMLAVSKRMWDKEYFEKYNKELDKRLRKRGWKTR